VTHLGFGRDKILKLLYDHPEGLCYREIGREGLGNKTLIKELPELEKEGLIRIEWRKNEKLHFLTVKGKEYVERNIACEGFMKRFVKFVDAYQPNERLEALGQLFKDMFAHSQELLYSGQLDAMRIFRAAIKEPLKDYMNRDILESKEAILEEGRGSGKVYCDPRLNMERSFPVGFVYEDAVTAWNSDHYLNSHHRYFFEKLGIHSKEEIEKKNEEWLEKHKDKSEVAQRNERLKELRIRLDIFRKIAEAEITEPIPTSDLEEAVIEALKKRKLPNWFFNLPKDYGDYLEDVT
jgi:DNA-binding PadR family transcriptional regulator